MTSITRFAFVSTINGQGNRERAILDAMDQLNIAVRTGMKQMTLEAINEAQNIPPDIQVIIGDGEADHYQVALKTWEDVEEFKAIPGVWAETINQWAHAHYRPASGKIDPDTWKRVKITIESV